MEHGEQHVKTTLHRKGYFYALLDGLAHTPESAVELLAASRGLYETFVALKKQLVAALIEHPLIAEHVERLRTIRGVSEITALSWALEIGDPERFGSIGRAVKLLRAVRATGRVGRQGEAGAVVEAAQSASADGADRGGRLRPSECAYAMARNPSRVRCAAASRALD